MIVKGDWIKQIAKIGDFNKIGDEFQVINVSEEGIIAFKTNYGRGIMTYFEFEKYFEKINKQNVIKNTWTDWIQVDDIDKYKYKTNNKRVIVNQDGIKAKSSCLPTDRFDLKYGILICLSRIKVKQAQLEVQKLIDSDK